MPSIFHDLMLHARGTAQRAGSLLAQNFGSALKVSSKSTRHDLVTAMEVESERLIVNELRSRTPGCSFIGEESGRETGTSGVTWVIDPLDGTVNYAHGIPLYCVSIAAVVDERVVAGAIVAPSLGETWCAARGEGAFCNDKQVHVSATSKLADSILVTGFPYDVSNNPGSCHEQFVSMLQRGLPIRRLGSAALDLAWTAAGRFDGFWEIALKPWDVAAGSLLVEESGGRITHYNNLPFSLSNESVIATNGRIHDELSEALSAATKPI